MLLAGEAGTGAQTTALGGSGAPFAALIDSWMASPGYAQAMTHFFSGVRRQNLATPSDRQAANAYWLPYSKSTAHNNFCDSSAKTAMAFVQADTPLTQAATTRSWMMTSHTMAVLAMNDMGPISDAGAFGDGWVVDCPRLVATAAQAFAPAAAPTPTRWS